MLPAAQRLRRSDEFAEAIRRGRRAGRGAVVVHLSLAAPAPDAADQTPPACTQDTSPDVRAGFVVSKAVGCAVVRNRVKRRLRHLVRAELAWLPSGSALVVRALPAAATASPAQLGADVSAAVQSALAGGARRRRR
ncbi:ribonuclease P protein component [Pilimelia columellifera]|uniref:Ribonuclease P protein component n=1 Tax=Pilimelia columellifera subsp. columellifera TaxID=706583 RepID=A0ABN3N0K0_9ACTN